MVGISGIRQGEIVAERYRVIERLTRFAVADSALTGVEYEYWLALDETRGVEVWIQVAESRGVFASGAQLAGVISSLRRLNHPAIPAVLDFGEIEVEAVEVEAVEDEVEDREEVLEESIVAGVGYVVLEPVEAESLATVLLRAALTEAEIFAVLIGIADVLKVLHEVELVHGHLSAYSFLLGERSILLVDLAAALALEVASESELTPAADVYALAWLACIALAGVEAVEAEFGVGYDAGSSPESQAVPQLLTIDLIERRRAWAEANLVATYGLRAELAALLVAALGEAGARPTVSELATALRRREHVAAAGVGMGVGVAAAVGAGAVGAAIVAAEVAEAAEVVEAVEVVQAQEAIEAAEVEAAEVVEEVESAAIVGSAAVVESAAVGVAEAEVVETEASRAEELVGAGVGVGVGGMGIGAEALRAGSRGSRGSGGGGGGTATAVASAPISPSSSPSGRHGSPQRRPRSAFYVALGIVGALIVAGVAYGCASSSSPTSVTPAAPGVSPSGSPTSPGQSGGGASASPSATAGQSAGAGVTPGASGTAAASPSGAATESAGTSASGQASSPAAPGYTPTPLATVPASPSQAIQQVKQTVSQAESAGQIPQQAQGSLNQAVSTLQHEIGSGASVQLGLNALQKALHSNGVPSGFVTQLNELIPYLVAHQGS